MNRCMHKLLFALFVTLFCMASAQAQLIARKFPDKALRGELIVTQPPLVLINGKAEQLSPGSRIKDETNLIVQSGTLMGKTYLVNYTREMHGHIHEVWILTAEEAAQKRTGMEPVTNFTFASDGNKPAVDDGKTPYNLLPKYKK